MRSEHIPLVLRKYDCIHINIFTSDEKLTLVFQRASRHKYHLCWQCQMASCNYYFIWILMIWKWGKPENTPLKKPSPRLCGRVLLCYRDAVCLQMISLFSSFSSPWITWIFIKCKWQKKGKKRKKIGEQKEALDGCLYWGMVGLRSFPSQQEFLVDLPTLLGTWENTAPLQAPSKLTFSAQFSGDKVLLTVRYLFHLVKEDTSLVRLISIVVSALAPSSGTPEKCYLRKLQ